MSIKPPFPSIAIEIANPFLNSIMSDNLEKREEFQNDQILIPLIVPLM